MQTPVYFIEGDGIGPDLWAVTRPVLDAALYEATHGTAPGLVGKDAANPSAMMLCGAMMLEAMGHREAANLIREAMGKAIIQGHVTSDMAQHMPKAVILGCKAYGDLIGQLL